MKRQFINELKPGDNVDDVFALAEKSVAVKKNGENFLAFRFVDRTGDIRAVAWDDVDAIGAAANAGDFVRVEANVTEFRGTPQLTVRALAFQNPETIRAEDFLAKTRHPLGIDGMFERLVKTVQETVTDPYLRALMDEFFADEEFVRRFKIAPAAKGMHHAFIGGLLEHTLSMTVLVRKIAGHYKGSLDEGLLMVGTVLHDIGKTREFLYDAFIDYSDEGKLVGHIAIGCGMVDEMAARIDGFPSETAWRVKHMILSHHGTKEFGSPVTPKILEAVLLNLIDNIDAKMNGIRDFLAGQDPNETWTGRNPMLGTS
ncbi:MAG: 3'-5' exoribonuclease YhaM family protein, partial [Desulfococcaceae bacterium]